MLGPLGQSLSRPCLAGAARLCVCPELLNASIDSIRIAAHGGYAYATAQLGSNVPEPRGRIFVVDFTNPHAPVHVATWGDAPAEVLEYPYSEPSRTGALYVVDWKNDGGHDGSLHRALAIFDIATNPAAPTLLGEYWSVGSATNVTVVGTTAYLCDEREGLLILDCSDPAHPGRLGGYHSPAMFHQAALDGHTLYVTDRRYGVAAVDVTNPREPQLLGKHDTGSVQNWGLAKRGDALYAAAGYAGLQVLDVTDPATPTLAGAFPFSGPRAVGLALYDDDVYGLIGAVGTSPAPGWSTSLWMTRRASATWRVVLDGVNALPLDIAISSTQNGITHIARENLRVTADISDPANPSLISTDSLRSQGLCLGVSALYVATPSPPRPSGPALVRRRQSLRPEAVGLLLHADQCSLRGRAGASSLPRRRGWQSAGLRRLQPRFAKPHCVE